MHAHAANIACDAVTSVADLGSHPALRRRTVTTEGDETIILPAPLIRWLDVDDADQPSAAPTIDQHGAALRAEFA
jgi:crotonobetainyl-CoA:carnitine CoA-transferase CaiB-like acyl-CoA transferase